MGEDWEQDVLEEARQTIIRSRGQIKFPIRIGTVFARFFDLRRCLHCTVRLV
jgi:hypothetical protein